MSSPKRGLLAGSSLIGPEDLAPRDGLLPPGLEAEIGREGVAGIITPAHLERSRGRTVPSQVLHSRLRLDDGLVAGAVGVLDVAELQAMQ